MRLFRGKVFVIVALAFATLALAQDEGLHFDLGSREAGVAHPLELMAENANCQQPLDFRFQFQNNSWLRAEGETEVRGVQQGQRLPLSAVIDLTNIEPGRHSTQVEVECLNCGFWFMRNCRVDRQVLQISVEAVAPEPAPPPPQQPPSTSVSTDLATDIEASPLDTMALSGAERTTLANAHDNARRAAALAASAGQALNEAARRKRRCDEELSALAAAAVAAQAQADAAAAQSAAAAQQASDAQSAVATDQSALDAAQGAIAHREEAVQIQINYLNLILPQDGPNSQRVQNAQQYIADAQAQLAAAQADVEAAQNALAASQAAAAAAAAQAQAAQAAAAQAQAAAAAAAAALTEKERECLGLAEAEAAAAQSASDAAAAAAAERQAAEEAEAEARAQAQRNLEQELADCRARCQRCREELVQLLIAQHKAMEALSQLGLLNPRQHDVVEQVTTWGQIGAAAQHMLTEGTVAAAGVPDMGAGVMLGALQAGYGLMQIHQSMMAPQGSTMGSAHIDDSRRLEWLEEEGFADDPAQAQQVLDEMANYMAHGRSVNNMNARLQRQRDACLRCDEEMARLEQRLAAAR